LAVGLAQLELAGARRRAGEQAGPLRVLAAVLSVAAVGGLVAEERVAGLAVAELRPADRRRWRIARRRPAHAAELGGARPVAARDAAGIRVELLAPEPRQPDDDRGDNDDPAHAQC